MDLKALLWNSTFLRVLLLFWIIMSGILAYFLFTMDRIVNVDLYNYGLQFSTEWAFHYWAILALMGICLVFPSALSGAALVASLISKASIERRVRDYSQETKTPTEKPHSVRENNMVISCPKCKRIFSKPLVMLDFTSGKTKFINACPHCYHTLEEEQGKEPNNDVHIAELDRKVDTSR